MGCAAKPIYIDKPVLYQKDQLELPPINIPIIKPVYVTLVMDKGEISHITMPLESYKNIILNNKMIELYIRETTTHIEAYIKYYDTL